MSKTPQTARGASRPAPQSYTPPPPAPQVRETTVYERLDIVERQTRELEARFGAYHERMVGPRPTAQNGEGLDGAIPGGITGAIGYAAGSIQAAHNRMFDMLADLESTLP